MLEDTADQRRFVVCGDNPMAYRLVEQLASEYDGQVTVIVPSVAENWSPRIAAIPGVRMVEAEHLDADAFTAAGLATADALGLLGQDDGRNIDAALIAQEVNPDVRVVIRMFNLSLGRRISALLKNCVVLSAAAIAAPVFVAAALDGESTAPMKVADRTLVATNRSRVRPDEVICGLAITEGREEPESLPASDDEAAANLVLATSRSAPRRRPRRRHRRLKVISVIFGARLRLALGILLGLFVLGGAALAWQRGSWLDGLYLALVSELGGANADPSATHVEKITIGLLTVVSIALIPALTAAIVDATVKARLRIEAGGLTEPISNHVIVVGLGNVGIRVIRQLDAEGVDMVAIERDQSARGVQIAREMQIPVIIGDASRAEVLAAASVATCRALVVVSTDDVINLEISLLGREAQPDLRVVMRMFDGEFARRVRRAFAIRYSRSVSYLAAPAFAAAMLGRQVIGTIPVRRRVLLVAELPVGAASALEGRTVADVQRPHEVRLIAIETAGRTLWALPPGRRLSRNDRVVVVATRSGLGHLLLETTPGEVDETVPFRLLEPSDRPQMPHTPTSADGEGPPLGPADAGSTRPA